VSDNDRCPTCDGCGQATQGGSILHNVPTRVPWCGSRECSNRIDVQRTGVDWRARALAAEQRIGRINDLLWRALGEPIEVSWPTIEDAIVQLATDRQLWMDLLHTAGRDMESERTAWAEERARLVAEIEWHKAAIHELNSYDAPAEVIELRERVDRLVAERDDYHRGMEESEQCHLAAMNARDALRDQLQAAEQELSKLRGAVLDLGVRITQANERTTEMHRRAQAAEQERDEAFNRGRAVGREDVGKYSHAIGQIEAVLGIVGARPMRETVDAVRRLHAERDEARAHMEQAQRFRREMALAASKARAEVAEEHRMRHVTASVSRARLDRLHEVEAERDEARRKAEALAKALGEIMEAVAVERREYGWGDDGIDGVIDRAEAALAAPDTTAPYRRATLVQSAEHGGHFPDCDSTVCHCPLGSPDTTAPVARGGEVG
jgi:hypothetical protein